MKINIKTSWNLAKILPNKNEEYEKKKISDKSYQFINKWHGRKDYLENPKILKKALLEYEGWLGYFAGGGNLGYFFGLKNALDQNNPEIKASLSKISDLATKIENDIQFFEYHLSKIAPAKQKLFLETASLKKYHHFLNMLFKNAKYLLSEKEEKLLNLTQETSYSNWVKMTSSILSKEQRKRKTLSELISLTESQNKKERNSAASALNDIFLKNADIAENEINSILKNKKVIDELKNIKRPDLPRLLEDDVEPFVVDSLIRNVTENFYISHKYYELKANILKVKKLKYHERNVEIGKIKTTFSFEKSVEIVHKVLRKLDPQFSEIFLDLVEKGSIDVYPKVGKAGGAFCAGGLISQPNFILLNHTNRLTDVLTLAHETGHSIHNFLSKKNQTPINYGGSTATAETASAFFEDFALEELLKSAPPQEKTALLMHKLNSDVATIFRQVACYNFERELHQNFRKEGYLSKEKIGEIFQKNMKSYMGDFVEQSAGSENWWVNWSHIRTFFYVYSYASGLLISKSLQKMVKENPKDIAKVKNFLMAGESKSPYQLFKEMGVDIASKNFWSAGIDEVEKLLNETETISRGFL
ncbi:MAG: M3 family oligoendopeptidase [Patescibacteria group bacterium]